MADSLDAASRAALLAKAADLDARLHPDDPAQAPPRRQLALLTEAYYAILTEYADRLPRVLMGACPFTGAPLVRSFDPFGVDGPWWWKDIPVPLDEPAAPPAFKVLLGALALRGGRQPVEARDEVIPGPDVPFVVPKLLRLPGMVAVLSRLDLETGDVAYPVTYWSEEEIPPLYLHQPWLRQELWFDGGDGEELWLISNATWEFDLEPFIQAGKLFWIEPGSSDVFGSASGRLCPFVGLAGDRLPQSLAWAERELLELPDGEPFAPFEDDEDDEDEDENEDAGEGP